MHLTLLSLTDIRVQTSGMYDKKKCWKRFNGPYFKENIS